MTDHIEGTLHPIPHPKKQGFLLLSDVIGVPGTTAIAEAKQITIHISAAHEPQNS